MDKVLKDGEYKISSKIKRISAGSKIEKNYNKLLNLWNVTTNSNKTKHGVPSDSYLSNLNSFKRKGHKTTSISSCDSEKSAMIDTSRRTLPLYSNIKVELVFTCSFCEHVFSSKVSLIKHKRKHNFCQYCKAKFKSMKSLNEHQKTCIFKKCMTSQPTVNLIDIALSKKVRLLYKCAFNGKNYPPLDDKVDLKQELIDCKYECNSFLYESPLLNNGLHHSMDIKIKQELIDSEYEFTNSTDNSSIRFSNVYGKSELLELENTKNQEIFSQTDLHIMEKLIKSEPMDIIEEPLLPFEFNLSHVKEEFFKVKEESLTFDEYSTKCFKYEPCSTDYSLMCINDSKSYCKLIKSIDKNKTEKELKTEYLELQGLIKKNKTISNNYNKEHTNQDTLEEFSKTLMDIKIETNALNMNQDELKNDSKKESYEILGNLGMKSNTREQPITSDSNKENLLEPVTIKSSISKTLIDLEKTATPRKVKYIRLTNKPNLNLFVY